MSINKNTNSLVNLSGNKQGKVKQFIRDWERSFKDKIKNKVGSQEEVFHISVHVGSCLLYFVNEYNTDAVYKNLKGDRRSSFKVEKNRYNQYYIRFMRMIYCIYSSSFTFSIPMNLKRFDYKSLIAFIANMRCIANSNNQINIY